MFPLRSEPGVLKAMNTATLKLEPHEGGATVSLEVHELTAMERLQFVFTSMRAAISGHAGIRIPHVRTIGADLRGYGSPGRLSPSRSTPAASPSG